MENSVVIAQRGEREVEEGIEGINGKNKVKGSEMTSIWQIMKSKEGKNFKE